jgi:metal-responsive CopG/Arc/MetJ family transcriptional regulator
MTIYQESDQKHPTRAPTTKRMSITLSSDIAQMVETLSQEMGISQNEVLRKAIASEIYFYNEIKSGSKVLIQKADKEIREVVFR